MGACQTDDHCGGFPPDAVEDAANSVWRDLNFAIKASYEEVRMILLNCAR